MAAVLAGERTGFEGKPIANRILLSLGERDFRALRPRLRFVQLKPHEVLHERNRKAEDVYFPDSGLISLIIASTDGRTAEAGVVGSEGVAGIEGAFGFRRSPLCEVVQVAGEAHQTSAASLQHMLPRHPDLVLRLSRFAVVNRMQISQTAACNRLHEIQQRLARWLLMTQDRIQEGLIRMTHGFLATMLGTNRGSVTEAALALQKRGLIEYSRGTVRVLNRKKLERSSCECYALIRDYSGELVRL